MEAETEATILDNTFCRLTSEDDDDDDDVSVESTESVESDSTAETVTIENIENPLQSKSPYSIDVCMQKQN